MLQLSAPQESACWALCVAIFVAVCLCAFGRAGLWTGILEAEDVAVAAGCQQVPAVRGQPACAHRCSDLPEMMGQGSGLDSLRHDRSTAALVQCMAAFC